MEMFMKFCQVMRIHHRLKGHNFRKLIVRNKYGSVPPTTTDNSLGIIPAPTLSSPPCRSFIPSFPTALPSVPSPVYHSPSLSPILRWWLLGKERVGRKGLKAKEGTLDKLDGNRKCQSLFGWQQEVAKFVWGGNDKSHKDNYKNSE
ncbi:hypothetical protein AVEN_174809-1 [Araneus ventricosus]|uniref:Uncharacterized protein n=1 Tax=Araneus ventricosus TaxID=182803 RepID=A0A4Y1ZNT8_ARAVE|nr:hypothetical protein AVEN_174809-1 [Araneus ventricosus]